MIGRVVSTKMKNTATVLVERTAMHPLYKKTYMQSKKYLVDTTEVEVKMGDIVDFIICKPISKNKHWRVTKVLGKTFAEIAEADLKKEAESIISAVMPEEKETEESSVVSLQPEKKAEQKTTKNRKGRLKAGTNRRLVS